MAAPKESWRDECHMKVNGQKGINMAVQDKSFTMELVISRHYKAQDHWGLNHMENTVEIDEDKVA